MQFANAYVPIATTVFPSNVSVSFKVGLSQYERIDASSFRYYIDFRDVDNAEDKLHIIPQKIPKEVFGIKLEPATVDYIIEEK